MCLPGHNKEIRQGWFMIFVTKLDCWCERSACARTVSVRGVDVVATKLGIILSSSFFFFFFLSFLPRTFLPEGVCLGS